MNRLTSIENIEVEPISSVSPLDETFLLSYYFKNVDNEIYNKIEFNIPNDNPHIDKDDIDPELLLD